jgi:bacterioferritin-associated ferredoxin
MILCVCHNISESTFKEKVREGLVPFGKACETLSLGQCCGKCCSDAKRIMDEELSAASKA